ncbi:hypothetical protein BDV93DRAFT_522407 [Ceratobasidium sp. AG-I]|nr:hypothetical protein BDV93DRAFT_522407 [Ceratobasidium sp. AG-I]
MSFTHMGAGLASPDSSSSQLYRRGVLIHCPQEYSVDIVPPTKEGSSWHYGLRVKPLSNLMGSPTSGPPTDAKGKRIKAYEIHRKWEDCLDLQRVLEKEYTALSKARKSRLGGKKGNSIYGHPQRAASFDSLPTGPDPKSIPTDIHAFLPRLAAKSSLFRGASGSALVQQRSEEFNEFISALFAPGAPALVDEARQAPAVREWFGFWRRDRDAMRRRDGDRASIAPSVRRLSIAPSEIPPLPTPASPMMQLPGVSPVSPINEEPRQSHETMYGDIASALDTFPMPPSPVEEPPATGFVPIVQRRLGSMRGEAARNLSFRNASFRNAQLFSAAGLTPVPASAPYDEVEYDSEVQQFDTIRARRTERDQTGRPRRATSPSWSSASTTMTHQTPLSSSPRSSQTSDWSMGLSAGIVQALAGVERDTPVPAQNQSPAEEQSEIAYMRKMSLSSLSSSSSSRRPPPIPPRSSLRRSLSSGTSYHARSRGEPSKPTPAPAGPGEVVVYDEDEPEFEIVTHSVLGSYLDDARASFLSSESAMSASVSGSGSSVQRRSMTPSVASGFSTSSAGRESVSSGGPHHSGLHLSIPSLSTSVPVPAPSPAPSISLPTPPAQEISLKAVCPVGDSIVVCRIARGTPLESVRRLLASKFQQAAGVELFDHGFVLGYLSQLSPVSAFGLTRPGTAGSRPGSRPGTAGSLAPPPPTTRSRNGRPGTAPGGGNTGGGRTRSSSVSSVCADPTHLTLIVTQRDWENAVAKHGEKMTVRVLLAGAD